MAIENKDELKQRARAAVDHLRWLMKTEDYEAAYDLIDEEAALKHPKEELVGYLRGIIAQLGTLEQWTLNYDEVLEEDSSLYIRQDYTVKYAKDRTKGKRYELLTWRVQSDESLKLWTFINRKGTD